MTLGLMGNLGKANFKELLPELIAELRFKKTAFVLDEAAAEGLDLSAAEQMSANDIPNVADVIISFGGDGTMLRTAAIVAERQVPIMGGNLGPGLGYLTELSVKALAKTIDKLLSGQFSVEERMMLRAVASENPQIVYHALNDIVVGNQIISRTLPVELSIDNEPVTTYRSDGLIVATPTGSTAYSLSAGGPIVEPKLHVMIVTPICPHMLTMRPVVISDKRTVQICVKAEATLAADGEHIKPLRSGETVRIVRAPFITKIATTSGHDFYHMLRAKLQWGMMKTPATV
jgi:NAD+ kinase